MDTENPLAFYSSFCGNNTIYQVYQGSRKLKKNMSMLFRMWINWEICIGFCIYYVTQMNILDRANTWNKTNNLFEIQKKKKLIFC